MTRLTPPQIAGNWRITKSIAVEQITSNGPVNFYTDYNKQYDVDVIIRQNEELVSVEYLNTTPSRSTLGTRLGVWQPKFENGKVSSWQLILSDYDDQSIAFLEIYKITKCGRVHKLWYNSTESGFDPQNRQRHPFAAREIWIRT